ncbi:MAG: hypothetical protein ACFFCS_23610 [Candidatus Hodarchaeota archaeon]
MNLSSEAFKKYDTYWALLISYAGGVLLTFTTIWQLCIIAPVIAGFLIKKKARFAWWGGFFGILLAWLTIILYFMATQPVAQLIDILIQIIIGSSGLGFIAVVLALLIGGLVGGTGGFIGFSVSRFFPTKREDSKEIPLK